MKIGLISDTHIPQAATELPLQVAQAFKGVDLILHAGDIYVPSALDWLEKIAPVMAARSNVDFLGRDDPRVKDRLALTLEGVRVGVVHFLLYPETISMTLEKSMSHSFGGPVDVIVFGDTHMLQVDTWKGVLLVNPGSPTLPGNFIKLGTVGILEIEQGRPRASILQLK